MSVSDLASDPIIVGMAMDLHLDGITPPAESEPVYADFVFAAAMEFVYRGGDPEGLDFSDPAEAVRLALLSL